MADKAIYSVDTVSTFDNANKLYINTGNNIVQISPKDIMGTMYKNLKLYAHTGRNLGTSYTTAQQTAIKNGTFEGLNIGDYWVINGFNWRIWDIDWYLNKGDTQCTTHHLVVMPDTCLLSGNGSDTHWMNSTDTTANGYAGTDYRKTHRTTCEDKVKAAFGNHILTHRELITTASSGGKASSWAWNDATVELPSEIMMYGSVVTGQGQYNIGTAYPQLELARLDPSRVCNRQNYWLRDVVGSAVFALVAYVGYAGWTDASSSWLGLRPYFLLSGI